MIERNGGQVGTDRVTIRIQEPVTIPLEIAFEGHYPSAKIMLNEEVDEVKDELSFGFDGIGFAVVGEAKRTGEEEHIFEVAMYIDGELIETAKLPTLFRD
jgi:hypothetical protein